MNTSYGIMNLDKSHLYIFMGIIGLCFLFGTSLLGLYVLLFLGTLVAFIVKPEIGLIIIAIMIPLYLRIPEYYSLLIGIDSLTLMETIIPITLLLAISSNIWGATPKIFRVTFPLPLIVFFGVLSMTIVVAPYKFEFFSQMAKWIMYYAFFILYSFHFRDMGWQRLLIRCLILSGTVLITVTMVPFILDMEMSRDLGFERTLPSMVGELRRFTSTFFQPNQLGSYLGFLLSLQFGFMLTVKRYRSLPVTSLITTFILGLGFLFSLSRGAWIALTVTFLVGMIMTRKETRVYRVLLIIILVGLIGQSLLPAQLLPDRLKDLLNLESSDLLARMSLWKGAWDMFRSNPLLGVGVGNFGPLYWQHWEFGTLFVESQWAVSAHNMYLQILATSGLLGFITFLWFILHFLRKAYRLVIQSEKYEEKGLYLGLMLALIFFCCHGLVDNHYSYISCFLPVFLTLALIQAAWEWNK